MRGACTGADFLLQPGGVAPEGAALDRLRGGAAAASDRKTLQAAVARSLLGQQDVADRVKEGRSQGARFVANQMTWRAPRRLVVARTATSLTAKPASRSRFENKAFGPDDQTASTPPGRNARWMVFNPRGS